MLHLHPELVEWHRAENFVPLSARSNAIRNTWRGGSISFGWQAQDLHRRRCGDATRRRGTCAITGRARRRSGLVVLIHEISRYPLSRIVANTAFD